MKIAIIGGHLTPALAVLNALPQDMQVVYIGRKHPAEGDKAVSLEYQTITDMGIPFVPLTTAKLQRRFTRYTIPSLAKIPRGMMQAYRLLRKQNPDVILSFGGYLSVPIGFAAYLLKIPIVIHEQTTRAGLANKLVSFFAKKICISFDSSRPFFPREKTVLTGDPILQTQSTKDNIKYMRMKTNRPLLVVVGGSQGSHAINVLIEGCLKDLLEKFTLIHQTGDASEFSDFIRLNTLVSTFPQNMRKNYLPVKFIHPNDVWYVLEKADLVISRAGINTALTVSLLNKPTIFIPLPYGQRNEQLHNAQMVARTGLGIVLRQSDASAEKLKEKAFLMSEKVGSYSNNQLETMRTLHLHAAQKVVDVITHL